MEDILVSKREENELNGGNDNMLYKSGLLEEPTTLEATSPISIEKTPAIRDDDPSSSSPTTPTPKQLGKSVKATPATSTVRGSANAAIKVSDNSVCQVLKPTFTIQLAHTRLNSVEGRQNNRT
jgi:hypothetical protein